MPAYSPEMKTLLFDLRRLLRQPLVREEVFANMREHMLKVTELLASRFTKMGSRPRFLKTKLHRMILGTLRSVENGRRALTFEKRFLKAVWNALRLLSGYFCRRTCPDPEGRCSICMSRPGGEWWWSLKCEHSFHVNCIAQSLEFDTRCPLCRVDLG